MIIFATFILSDSWYENIPAWQHGYDNLQYCPYVDMISLYSLFQDYTFGCNTKVQYIKQNVQYNAYPKIHQF